MKEEIRTDDNPLSLEQLIIKVPLKEGKNVVDVLFGQYCTNRYPLDLIRKNLDNPNTNIPEKAILIRFLNKQGYISDETVRKLAEQIPGVEYYLFVGWKRDILEGRMNTKIDDEVNLILDTLRDNKQITTRVELSR